MKLNRYAMLLGCISAALSVGGFLAWPLPFLSLGWSVVAGPLLPLLGRSIVAGQSSGRSFLLDVVPSLGHGSAACPLNHAVA